MDEVEICKVSVKFVDFPLCANSWKFSSPETLFDSPLVPVF